MYHKIFNGEIVRTYPADTREIYLPVFDRHIKPDEFEAHDIFWETTQPVDVSSTKYIMGSELHVIEGRPVRVTLVADKTPEMLTQEIEAWREQASLPRHIAMIILRKAGVRGAIQQAINSIADPSERADAQDAFDHAPTFRRNDVFVLAIGAKTGLTAEQLDQLFRQGGA